VKAREIVKIYVYPLFTRSYWQMLSDYVGIGRRRKPEVIIDQESLASFLSSRSSHVAQTSLYGYLRTRAGTRFPELFENPDILTSINIAKWHIWLACVSDLCVFIGQTMFQSGRVSPTEIESLMPSILDRILEQTEIPAEAGEDFESAIEKERQRISSIDWSLDRDDDTIFSRSPSALYYWSPIADELKQRAEIIVRNSVRFRWIEIRRSARQQLDIDLIFLNESSPHVT
jgi:hypothetical protein